jgi:hypothetical protein
VKFDNALEEAHLPLDDVKELLAGHRRRREADKIDGMASPERIPYLALSFEAADAGSLPGPRVYDNYRTFCGSTTMSGGGIMRESV